MMASGNSVAAMRSGSCLSAEMAINEQIRGISMLRFLQQAEQSFTTEGEAFCALLQNLARRVFTRERLTVCLAGVGDTVLAQQLRGLFHSEPMGERQEYQPREKKNEGFTIPAGVAYTALSVARPKRTNAHRVATQFLTYDYLWQAVRVMGGAYGTGATIRPYSTVFTSYRDPSPAATLETFRTIPDQLRAYANSGEKPDKYIISTIASAEPLLTPRARCLLAAGLHFTGKCFLRMEEYACKTMG